MPLVLSLVAYWPQFSCKSTMLLVSVALGPFCALSDAFTERAIGYIVSTDFFCGAVF